MWFNRRGFEVYKTTIPFEGVDELVDGLFDEVFQPMKERMFRKGTETKDHCNYTFDVPGFCREDLTIEYDTEKNYLHIKGKKNDREIDNTFLWQFKDVESISASVELGVLTLKIPKKTVKNNKLAIPIT